MPHKMPDVCLLTGHILPLPLLLLPPALGELPGCAIPGSPELWWGQLGDKPLLPRGHQDSAVRGPRHHKSFWGLETLGKSS